MAFGALLGTLAGSATSIGNPIDATGSVVVAVGDLVFGGRFEQTNMTATTVTDNLGNTYTAQNAGTDAGTTTARTYYSRVTVPGTLTAVHFAGTSSTDNGVAIAAVIQGPFASSPLDANPANALDATTPFTCPSTGTLAQPLEVVMAWGTTTGSASWTATAPNLLAVQQATASVLKAAIGYQTVNATTAVIPVFSGTSGTDGITGTASFKADTTSPAGQCCYSYEPPKGAKPVITNRTIALGLALLLTPPPVEMLPSTAQFFNPWGPARANVGFVLPSSGPLLAPAAVVEAPFSQGDWPNPRWIKTWRDWFTNPITLRQAAAVQAPFSQDDWPVPRGPRRSTDLGWAQAPQLVTVTPPDTTNLPSAAQFYNPWGPRRLSADWSVNPATLRQVVAAVQAPLAKTDWPNPRVPQRSRELLTWINPGFLSETTYVFRQPLIFRNWRRDSTVAVNTGILPQPLTQKPVVVVAKPFAQYAWLAPSSRPFGGDLRTWVSQTNVPLVTTPPPAPPPISQLDWPVPQGAAFAKFLRDWSVSVPTTLLPPGVVVPPVVVPPDEPHNYYGRWPKDFIYDRPYLWEYAEALRKAVQKKQPAKVKVLADKILEASHAVPFEGTPEVAGVIEFATKLSRVDADDLELKMMLNLARALEIRAKLVDRILQDEEDAETLLLD